MPPEAPSTMPQVWLADPPTEALRRQPNTCSGVVGTLCMTLENTQAGGTQGRGDVLATLYFSVTGNPTLTAESALADVVLQSIRETAP